MMTTLWLARWAPMTRRCGSCIWKQSLAAWGAVGTSSRRLLATLCRERWTSSRRLLATLCRGRWTSSRRLLATLCRGRWASSRRLLATCGWCCGSRVGRRVTGGGVLMLVVAGWILGCGSQADVALEPGATAQPPGTAGCATAGELGQREPEDAPVAVTVWKVPIDEVDPFEAVFAAQESLRRETAGFVDRLVLRLTAADAAGLRSMQRVFTTGQLLRELRRWMAAAENADLVDPAAGEELERLVQGWRECEQLIAALPRGEEDGER